MNKKGISDLMGMVVIILLTITATTLLFIYVNDTIKISQFSPISCTEYQKGYVINFRNACYNDINNNLEIIFNKDEKIEVRNIEVRTEYENGNTQNYNCGNICGDCELSNPEQNDNYYINIPNQPKTINLYSEGCFIKSLDITTC